MMTRNSALDKFLLSRKFIVCIIVLQFILLPIATKGFRWENIGDLIIYTLSHALIQGMYPYAWTFQIVSLVMLMLLVLRRVTMSRWFMFYVEGCYVLYAIVQNVAVTDKYGFSIVTVNVVMMLLVALLWMREAWRGSSMLTFGNLNPKDSMADTRGTLLPMVAYGHDAWRRTRFQPDTSVCRRLGDGILSDDSGFSGPASIE